MNDIPTGTAHVATTAPGIVVPESFDYGVPYRSKMIDEESFRQCDPDRHDHKLPGSKLGEIEIFGLLD